MNTKQQTVTHKKAHADHTGLDFSEHIADFDNATKEQRGQDTRLKQLDSLQDDLRLPTNHTDNIRYLHDDISIRGGDGKGVREPNTRGGFGLVMLNNRGEPVNYAALIINSDDTPIISDLTKASSFVIGSMSRDSEWWLVIVKGGNNAICSFSL